MNQNFIDSIIEKGKGIFNKITDKHKPKTEHIGELCLKLEIEHIVDTLDGKLYAPYFYSVDNIGPTFSIIVVSFHHHKGSIIEFVYPEESRPFFSDENSEQVRKLTFYALPDNAHSFENDYAFFILNIKGSIFHCITCFRQIDSTLLKSIEKRSFVQKAVCIVSQYPLYGIFLNKLDSTTFAYFNQKKFEDINIIKELYDSMIYGNNSLIEYTNLFLGFPLQKLVLAFKEKLFYLIKLLMLEKRIVVYSKQASAVTTFVLAVCSLFPGLLAFTYEKSVKINNYVKAQKMYGMPFILFHKEVCLMPLVSLDDLSILKKNKGFFIGTSNLLITQVNQSNPDCVINLDEGKIEIIDQKLITCLKCSSYEFDFIEKLLKQIKASIKNYDQITWSCIKTGTNLSNSEFSGSDDFIRLKFKKYFQKMMINLAFCQSCLRDIVQENKKGENENEKMKKIYDRLNSKIMGIKEPKELKEKEKNKEKKKQIAENHKLVKRLLKRYNTSFLNLWLTTYNGWLWIQSYSHFLPNLFKLQEPSHNNVIFYENGDNYSGSLFGGDKEGRGVFTYDEGNSIYDGEWSKNLKNGNGQLITQKNKYVGTFANDKFNGHGILCDKLGNMFEGEWENGSKTGTGTMQFSDGSKYVGEFLNDKYHGKGQLTNVNGDVFSGYFKEGKRHGDGHELLKSGIILSGYWEDDYYKGEK